MSEPQMNTEAVKNNGHQNTILATKLFIPKLRPDSVSRSNLIERLNDGIKKELILVSAPAGFGKTTFLTHLMNLFTLDYSFEPLMRSHNPSASCQIPKGAARAVKVS